MSLRFIYGKSGTGKTYFCFNEIRKLIDNNKKIYIITPEQFSFTAEKNLMNISKNKAVINAEVITFKRMAYRIINEEGIANKRNITNSGKAMLIKSIIEKQKANLNFLGKTDKNLDLVIRSITELKKNNISIELLKNHITKINDKYINLKLNDILTLYKEFNKKIEIKYLDDDDLLTIVKNKTTLSDMFKDSYIFIDEFAGFTKQEYSIIEEFLKIATEVNITICSNSLEESNNKETDIFSPNKKTANKIKELAQKNDIEILKDIELSKVYRFKNSELQYLSDNLYSISSNKYLEYSKNIRIFLASNNYSEIENVANNIIELVRDKKYRYRDISVITKNIEDYASLIKVIFKKYSIPVFIDEKKDLNQNILIKYIMALLNVLSKNFSMESVINYIKTGFTQLDDDVIYNFENYCKKLGISGLKKFSKEWEIVTEAKEDINNLNKARINIIMPLINLKEELGKNKTVRDITKCLFKFLEENNVQVILNNKIDKFLQLGEIEIANIYTSTWNILIDILDELVLILGDEKTNFETYMELLKVGFNNSELGKIPATLDQVIVGDVDRTRSAKKKIIFIIGLNDGKFPSSNKSEGFINDEERIYLSKIGLELAKTTKEQIYDENFNIYKAFSTAEEMLFLSYSASDNDGKGLRKSILLNKIKKIMPNIKEESDIIENKTYISSKSTTFDQLIINLRKYLNGENIDKIWFTIYEIYSKDEQYKDKLQKSIQGFYYTNIPENINKENLDKLYKDEFTTSISKLESYRKCPFSYYLKYALRLSDRTELKLERLDTGTFMHNIIDNFFSKVNYMHINIEEITEEQTIELIEEIVNEKLLLKQNYIFNSIPKYVVLTQRLKKVIITSITYIIETIKSSSFKVLGTEIEFGQGKDYEPIKINLEGGKKVEIIGKIDRIDIAEDNKNNKYIRIIDYKSSIKNIDLNEVVAGIQIQLLTYLDAVSKRENAISAGTLYFNLIDPIIKTKNKNLSEEQIKDEIRNNFKMNGLILGDIKVVKMMDNTLVMGDSNIIPAYIDKDGQLSKSKSRILEKEDFKKLQEKVEDVIKEIAKEITSGIIKQKPIYITKNKKTACSCCSYKAICGFNTKICGNNYNFIPNLKKNEILENIKNEKI